MIDGALTSMGQRYACISRRLPEVGAVATDPASLEPQEPEKASASVDDFEESSSSPRFTRVSATWVATAAALVLLLLLIVFILQNSTSVAVHFFWFSGSLSLGMALLIAAVAGGVVVAIAGIARVTQLRLNARRTRDHSSKR
jgi:uncharacterized integral membrane protein